MIYKKFIIIFLLILSIFSFSSVHAENVNVISSSSERMKADIDYFKQVLKNNNINNMDDLKLFVGATSVDDIQYFYIGSAGRINYNQQYVYFYSNFNGLSLGFDNYDYYAIRQNSFNLPYVYGAYFMLDGSNVLKKFQLSGATLTAPICWFGVKTADLFTIDSSQIVSNAVENANKSINNLNDKITEDNSNQDDINLGSHNDEMNNSSDAIKNSNLYTKFNNIIDKMNDAFSYNDNRVLSIPIQFYGKIVVLRSDAISSFFKNNNLGFVVSLWQSMLWFSLFYTMYIFIRKLYKAFTGGNPVDEVSSTLSSEDNKIVGGF